MPDIYNNLRKAIDEQDIAAVRAFIAENPDLDYSNISPNGASALWWALMPARDKTISDALVRLLLSLRKNDGNLLVSPVQSFAGLTPYQYISLFGERFRTLSSNLYIAENEYVAPRNPQNRQGNLAAIAMDGQSAHDSSVERLTCSNIIALYKHYVQKKGLALDKDSLDKAYAEIKDFIAQIYKKSSTTYSQTLGGLDYCFKNVGSFAFNFEEEDTKVEFNVTLAALVTLNWLAAQEQEVDLLPSNANDAAGLLSRKTALLITLYDIATAYGLNHPSCAGGACNRLGMTLAAQHALVKTYQQGELIQGEMARIIILRILGQTLASLSQQEPGGYAKILCYLSMTEPEGQAKAAGTMYQEFIQENNQTLREKLEDGHVAPQEIEKYIFILTEGNYPVRNHVISYELIKLLPFLEESERAAFFNGEITFDEILAKAKGRICQKLHASETFNAFLTAYGCIPYDSSNNAALTLAEFFVSVWLKRARFEESNRDINHVIEGFTKEEDEIFARETFWVALFLAHKPHLKEIFPKQARWLDSLTDREIITLFSTMDDAMISLLNHDANAFMSIFVTKALEIGITANLVLENMTFEHMDFRGHNFSGLHFKDITFKNCLLPFAGDNIQCENVVFEQCTLPALGDIDVDTLSHKLLNLCDKPHPPSNLVINFFLSLPCAPALLEKTTWDGQTALHIAAERGHTSVAQVILNSPHCTVALLGERTMGGYTALHIAAKTGNAAIAQAILTSPHSTPALLLDEEWRLKRRTAFYMAIEKGHTGVVQAILDSPHFTPALLEETTWGDGWTALHIAAERGHTSVVQAILNSPHFTPALLEKTNRYGETALHRAAESGHTDVVQAILDSRYSTPALLKNKNRDGQTAFRIAYRNGHQDVVQAIMDSPHSPSSRFFSKPTIIGIGIGSVVLGGLAASGIAAFILLTMPPINIGLMLIFTALMLGSLMVGSVMGAKTAKSFERGFLL